MGKYDSEKDVVMHCYEEPTEKGKLRVTVHSYNGGERKVQITRMLVAEAGVESFVKLGRLTASELKSTVALLAKAQEAIGAE